jgi:Lon protease-like protein
MRADVTNRILPMFPLGSVLLPTMLLPLYVFEPRYPQLMHDVLAGDRIFGVALIERGHEVGGDDVRSDIGTAAKILEAQELDDGSWAVMTTGVQRLRVLEWLRDDPYPRAEVELIDEVAGVGSPTLRASTLQQLRRVLALARELGDDVPAATTPVASDPMIASWQLSTLAPFGPHDTQRLLLIDDPDTRMRAVANGLTDVERDLQLRLALDLELDSDSDTGPDFGPEP